MSRAQKAYLFAVNDNGQWERIPITRETKLGREQEHEIFACCGDGKASLGTRDQSVTRSHASLYWDGGKLFIKDEGSLNGTWLNGRPLPGWRKPKTGGKRFPSRPVEIKTPSTVFFGHYTGAFVSFDGNTVPIGQGVLAVLPLDSTVDCPMDFSNITVRNNRSTVIPNFSGSLDVHSGKLFVNKVTSGRDMSDEENLDRCLHLVLRAVYSWTRNDIIEFEAHIQTLMPKLQLVNKKPGMVGDIFEEHERMKFHKAQREDAMYRDSCKRMHELLDNLKITIDNIKLCK